MGTGAEGQAAGWVGRGSLVDVQANIGGRLGGEFGRRTKDIDLEVNSGGELWMWTL